MQGCREGGSYGVGWGAVPRRKGGYPESSLQHSLHAFPSKLGLSRLEAGFPGPIVLASNSQQSQADRTCDLNTCVSCGLQLGPSLPASQPPHESLQPWPEGSCSDCLCQRLPRETL